MTDVFISYARTNFAVARQIAQGLRASGCSVWFDEDLPAHRAYADVISEKLDEARAVVVLWSTESALSHWVRSEANRARERGTLVQLRLDEIRLPIPFDQIQCLDFRGWHGAKNRAEWQRLMAAIGELRQLEEGTASKHAAPMAASREIDAARRKVIIGGSTALAAAGLGLISWREFVATPDPPPEVHQLIQKAQTIMQDTQPAEHAQALAYMLEATRISPQFAQAWGLLAFMYALNKFQVPKSARPSEDMRCRSAARTALGLDKSEPFANCALALLVPSYRNWVRVERIGQNLAKRFSFLPLANHIHSDVLADVGRLNEAVSTHAKIDRKRFLIPLSERSIVQSLWSAGDMQQAESLLRQAAERWPKNTAIWDLRINFLTFSGRPEEAVGLLENRSAHPLNYPAEQLDSALLTARGLAGAESREDAIRGNLEILDDHPSPEVLTYLNRKISLAQLVAHRCAALGDGDSTFTILDGYYFGRGPFAKVRPSAGDEDCTTVNLFEPPMHSVVHDTRFAGLIREIGLERYWQDTRTQPDFRQRVG